MEIPDGFADTRRRELVNIQAGLGLLRTLGKSASTETLIAELDGVQRSLDDVRRTLDVPPATMERKAKTQGRRIDRTTIANPTWHEFGDLGPKGDPST